MAPLNSNNTALVDFDPGAPEASEASRRRTIDEFVDQLDEILLLVHDKEIRKQSDFDITSTSHKSPSELEEDLDNLLKITRPESYR